MKEEMQRGRNGHRRRRDSITQTRWQTEAKAGKGRERQVRLPGGTKWETRQEKIRRQRPRRRWKGTRL